MNELDGSDLRRILRSSSSGGGSLSGAAAVLEGLEAGASFGDELMPRSGAVTSVELLKAAAAKRE